MRSIRVPNDVMEKILSGRYPGAWVECAVCVDWPELRLTEEQIIANAVATAAGQPAPYPDHSIFSVVMPNVAAMTPRPLPKQTRYRNTQAERGK